MEGNPNPGEGNPNPGEGNPNPQAVEGNPNPQSVDVVESEVRALKEEVATI